MTMVTEQIFVSYFRTLVFFYPFYDGKSINIGTVMEHANEDIYFRDIHFFIDWITDVLRTKIDIVRQNFQLYFRNSVLEWYIF